MSLQLALNSDNEDVDNKSNDENSDSASLDADEPFSAKQKVVSQKKGRKSTWQECQINDLVDVICSSEYFKKGLIFTNTKNSKNGEIYEQVLKQVKERYVSQGLEFPFAVSQIRNKFKKCISECKKIALTVKTASGIKGIQDEKNFGSWFTQLYELVKTRDSCRPELTIEPSFRASPSSELERTDNMDDNESEFDAENPSGSERSHSSARAKRTLFVPIRKAKTQKKEEILSTAVEILNKVVDSNPTKELVTFFKEENERAHELRLMQMFMSTANSENTNNLGCSSGGMPRNNASNIKKSSSVILTFLKSRGLKVL